MKKNFIFAVCVVLGAMTTGCSWDNLVEDSEYVPVGTSLVCEPLNDTHYLISYYDSSGIIKSTALPYTHESENNLDYEVIKTHITDTLKRTRVTRESCEFFEQDGFNCVKMNYVVCMEFADYNVDYCFTAILPASYSTVYANYEPTFKVEEYHLTDLKDVKEGENEYFCSELDILFRVSQGEKCFDFVKTVQIQEKKIPIEFDPVVDEWKSVNVGGQ